MKDFKEIIPKCLHPDCNNKLSPSIAPYCGFVCWLANNVDLGMHLTDAKAKMREEHKRSIH